MAIVLLIRHGRSTANTAGVLAGRAPGVKLDATGRDQAEAAAQRVEAVRLVQIVSSPLERCRDTAQLVADLQPDCPIQIDDAITECDYGAWQGEQLSQLAKDDLWQVVQKTPSAVTFPHGESMTQMQERAVKAIRSTDQAIEVNHGAAAVWAAVSHGDVIKSILADALGMGLDDFQRIHVDPASISIVQYGTERPTVVAMNTTAGDLSWLRTAPAAGDAPVGGGAGVNSGKTQSSGDPAGPENDRRDA